MKPTFEIRPTQTMILRRRLPLRPPRAQEILLPGLQGETLVWHLRRCYRRPALQYKRLRKELVLLCRTAS